MNNLLINLQEYEEIYPTLCFFKDRGQNIDVSFYDKLIVIKRHISTEMTLYNHKNIYIPFKAYLNNGAYKGETYIRLIDPLVFN